MIRHNVYPNVDEDPDPSRTYPAKDPAVMIVEFETFQLFRRRTLQLSAANGASRFLAMFSHAIILVTSSILATVAGKVPPRLDDRSSCRLLIGLREELGPLLPTQSFSAPPGVTLAGISHPSKFPHHPTHLLSFVVC